MIVFNRLLAMVFGVLLALAHAQTNDRDDKVSIASKNPIREALEAIYEKGIILDNTLKGWNSDIRTDADLLRDSDVLLHELEAAVVIAQNAPRFHILGAIKRNAQLRGIKRHVEEILSVVTEGRIQDEHEKFRAIFRRHLREHQRAFAEFMDQVVMKLGKSPQRKHAREYGKTIQAKFDAAYIKLGGAVSGQNETHFKR